MVRDAMVTKRPTPSPRQEACIAAIHSLGAPYLVCAPHPPTMINMLPPDAAIVHAVASTLLRDIRDVAVEAVANAAPCDDHTALPSSLPPLATSAALTDHLVRGNHLPPSDDNQRQPKRRRDERFEAFPGGVLAPAPVAGRMPPHAASALLRGLHRGRMLLSKLLFILRAKRSAAGCDPAEEQEANAKEGDSFSAVPPPLSSTAILAMADRLQQLPSATMPLTDDLSAMDLTPSQTASGRQLQLTLWSRCLLGHTSCNLAREYRAIRAAGFIALGRTRQDNDAADSQTASPLDPLSYVHRNAAVELRLVLCRDDGATSQHWLLYDLAAFVAEPRNLVEKGNPHGDVSQGASTRAEQLRGAARRLLEAHRDVQSAYVTRLHVLYDNRSMRWSCVRVESTGDDTAPPLFPDMVAFGRRENPLEGEGVRVEDHGGPLAVFENRGLLSGLIAVRAAAAGRMFADWLAQ